LARFPRGERLAEFRTLVSSLPRLDHIDPADTADFLHDLANAHGLCGVPGSDTSLEIEKIIGDAISVGSDHAETVIAINAAGNPWEASRALQSWERILAGADPRSLAMQFTRAATEVLRLASTQDQTRQLTYQLHAMGERHGLSFDVMETLLAAATVAQFDHRPSETRPVVLPEFNNATPFNEPDYEGGTPPKLEAASIHTQPLKLTYFDECGDYANKQWILKGIIALGETSAWIAPPGAGKSALLTEIAVHCAAQIDWRGHRAKAGYGVVVLALERGDLFKRRLHVYQQRDGLTGLPIAVADAIIDLLDPNCVETIVSTVRTAERRFGREVGLIILDTYAKGIAASGGDEDKARDQNRAAANLRKVHAQLDVHIALVGHTGKDESRGARGSNAHVGDVDVMVQISGETIKVARVIKGNDQPERTVAQFKFEAFELGRDEDGEPITTAIVTTETLDEPIGTQPAESSKRKLPPKPQAALRALHGCVAGAEVPQSVDERSSAGAKGIALDVWRSRLEKLAIINTKGKGNPREQFVRICKRLNEERLIGIADGFVWPVT
jgi:hypothetical protein